MRISTNQLFNAQAITGTNAYTSDAIPLDFLHGFSVVLTTTSTATGTAKLQASVDGSVWVDLPNSGATANIVVSGAGSALWNVAGACYKSARVVYTNATNSGTLSVTFYAKQGAL
jgi:hypothetical protein